MPYDCEYFQFYDAAEKLVNIWTNTTCLCNEYKFPAAMYWKTSFKLKTLQADEKSVDSTKLCIFSPGNDRR